jgi:DNA-binding IscR family transcriptional regulator
MRVGTRFSIAVHILAALGHEQEPGVEATSEYLAASIGVNPVVVRRVIGQLRRAGLVKTSQGVAGASLSKPLAEIALLDVFRAIEPEGEMFAIHGRPNPKCPIGAGIQSALECFFGQAQRSLEGRLEAITLSQVLDEIHAHTSRSTQSYGETNEKQI